jgi:hypothetical protein
MQHKSPAQPATTRKRQRGTAARGGDLAQHSSNTCLVQGAPTLQRRCRQRAQPQGRQHPPLSMPASTSVGAVRAAHASPASWLRMAIYHADTHACLHQMYQIPTRVCRYPRVLYIMQIPTRVCTKNQKSLNTRHGPRAPPGRMELVLCAWVAHGWSWWWVHMPTNRQIARQEMRQLARHEVQMKRRSSEWRRVLRYDRTDCAYRYRCRQTKRGKERTKGRGGDKDRTKGRGRGKATASGRETEAERAERARRRVATR